MMSQIGIVVIGRNEGVRLVRCLKSVIDQVSEHRKIVYVDSGSTDGSVEVAQSLGLSVVCLDPSIPFTMARGRNTGFTFLTQHFKDLSYIQFIDGDCELLPGWLDAGTQILDQQATLAIVCGRLYERAPESSPYNRLADMEWNVPPGEANACGGNALMRVQALQEVEGYNATLICGEEPEMCIRLRQRGWKILRVATEMAIHDIAMTKFSQWWTRSVRGGWAVAEGAALYGQLSEHYMVREQTSGWLWGCGVPMLALSLAWLTHGLSFGVLLGYFYLMLRVYQSRLAQGDPANHARLYAFFCALSKFPQAIGQLKYWLTHWQGQPATLIEYKTSTFEIS